MHILDGITPLERIQISGQVAAKIAALQGDLAPLARVKVSGETLELLQRLGAGIEPESVEEGGLSDDPNSPNYRFADTGYIAGSRKELAQELIKSARADGRQVLATDLDWDEIEKNPRLAAELIVKSNLFGVTDWEALKESGMSAAAGFLIDRVYASISTQPSEETPRARQDYAIALKTIRERLEACKEAVEVVAVLDEIVAELSGSQLNAEESVHYEALQIQIDALSQRYSALYKERKALGNAINSANAGVWEFQRKQEQRTRRGWKLDDDLQAKIDAAKPAQDAALADLKAWEALNPDFEDKWTTIRDDDGGVASSVTGGLRSQIGVIDKQQKAITKAAQKRNIMESPITRGWLTFGERFFKVINYRSYKGSDSFAGHVTNATRGKIPDWSWAEKEPKAIKRATKQQINFQLKVAEHFERVGGTPVQVDSTLALKNMLGFRDVQSGNWVLKDPISARFHVEQTAGAMMDLGDITGIPASALGLGGRLGMAFGARGTGNAGGSTAKATYEGVHRVINLTKMGGGGSLGHEWFHAIDDMLGELSTGEPTKARNYASIDAGVLPAGALRSAMQVVQQQLVRGAVRSAETIAILPGDKALVTARVERGIYAGAKLIKAAGELGAAVIAIDDYYRKNNFRGAEKSRKEWRRLAAAYYSEEPPEGGAYTVQAKTGPMGSSFLAEAVRLDDGVFGKYWSKPHEMAARAFQSWCEDRLRDGSRQNDYLSSYADNKYHYDAMFGIQWNPYPEGEERERINTAFDGLFETIRDEKVFERAMANKDLMDSIFGSDARDELTSLLFDLRDCTGDLRVVKAQRIVELMPQVVFDSPEEEAQAIASAAAVLEEVAHAGA